MSTTNVDLFPDSPRVIYDKAPLVEVVCQLRFPRILRIETQAPADFQDAVRDVFPLLEKVVHANIPPGVQVPPEILQVLESQLIPSYQFLTEDRSANVTLAPDSISLSTTRYERWEQFCGALESPLSALIEIYKPSFFSRIGLRYINAIERKALGLDAPWSELLSKDILGEIALRQFENNLQAANRLIVITLPDQTGLLALRHGLGQVQGHDEVAYTIDFDFYTDKRTKVENAKSVLEHFNKSVGRAFRWCISDTLHRTLGPRLL